jgi:hypothetical protein
MGDDGLLTGKNSASSRWKTPARGGGVARFYPARRKKSEFDIPCRVSIEQYPSILL